MSPLFTIEGKVQRGKNRGKSLGFPTANFPVDQNLEEGIYISQTKLNDKHYSSLTFIGKAKTFNENIFQAETYLLNFDQDIYGKDIKVNILKKIRNNKKFDSEEELIEQIEKDKIEAEEYFESLLKC